VPLGRTDLSEETLHLDWIREDLAVEVARIPINGDSPDVEYHSVDLSESHQPSVGAVAPTSHAGGDGKVAVDDGRVVGTRPGVTTILKTV
jgi:hypothetical protein